MKNLKSIAGAVAFMVLWAGAAIAMPTSFFADDEPSSTVEDLVVEDQEAGGVEEGETEEVDESDEDQDGDVGTAERPDNHGKAVSTAAHCDLKGRAKGALVSSVARDKGATVESAQAACDAAVADATTGAASSGKPAKAAKPEKPAKASNKPDRGAQGKTTKPAGSETVTTDESSSEVEEDSSVESGPPVDAGSPADKGGSKKP